MKKLLPISLIFLLSACYSWNFSDKVDKFDSEHISVAILELGPNYSTRKDSIVGKVYTWHNAYYTHPEMDTTGQVVTSAFVSHRYVHIFTTEHGIIKRTIYSVR